MTETPFHLTAGCLNHPALSHGFFGRRGGVSTGLLASLNTGYGADDTIDNIEQNRARIRAALAASALVSPYQTHSATVLNVTAPFASGHRPEADALVTSVPGLALGIVTADCVPVLFADPGAGIIGAAHAGWQGALGQEQGQKQGQKQGGIAHRTLEAMLGLGARLGNIRCAIGPAIQQHSYEVGDDLRQRFLMQSQTSDRFFTASDAGKFRFDLPGYVAAQLRAAGVPQIETIEVDTYSDPGSWFSYRRSTHRADPRYGSHLSAICLN